MIPPHLYYPDLDSECRLCGTSPTVIVLWHEVPQTELCGPHFFDDPAMVDWELWNDREEPESE